MRITTFLFGLILLAASCQPPAEDKQDTATSQPTSQPTAVEEPAPASLPEGTIVAIYKSCTAYAGATDYYFEKQDGSRLEIRVANLPEDRQIQIPDNMMDPNSQEGPPGANPALIGSSFAIFYDEEKVVKIELQNQ